MTVRWFWVPSADAPVWELVEARRGQRGWELRRPGKFGARLVPEVPIPGEDWVEVLAPQRVPRPPVVRPAKAAAAKAKPVRLVVQGDSAAPAKPRVVPERPERKAGARHTKPVPKLSRELLDLLAQEQRDQPAPAGKTKCPRCGLPLVTMKVRKVRTHDNPLTGTRCEASGTKLA